MEVECPLVTMCQIFGDYVEKCLLAMLLALPSLRFLIISNALMESREVVLEHSYVEGIEIAHSKVDNLKLVMPSLVQVGLVESCVQTMQVTSDVAVTFKTGIFEGKVINVIPGGKMVTLNF